LRGCTTKTFVVNQESYLSFKAVPENLGDVSIVWE
jgi:hypothetical protein